MERTDQFTLPLSIEEARAFYADLPRFAALHPLITKVELLSENYNGDEVYQIKEKPFSWSPIHIKYIAIVEVKPEHINYTTKGGLLFPNPAIRYEFTAINDTQTQLRVTIETKHIAGPLLLFKMMMQAQRKIIEQI